MPKRLIFVLLFVMLLLAGCKENYPCNSRERRSECERYLGNGYDMVFFDEIEDLCNYYVRYDGERHYRNRQRCVSSFFPDVEFEIIEGCYSGIRSFSALIRGVQCIENNRGD